MEQKTDQSYGVIPLHKNGADWQVLLINQIGRKGDTFWTFPKGHPEENEIAEESALRELQEETGIIDVSLDDDIHFTTAYTFIHEDIQIDKQVTYYLGFVHNPETDITQPQEVADLQWCSIEAALQQLSHQNTQKLLQQVQEYINARS